MWAGKNDENDLRECAQDRRVEGEQRQPFADGQLHKQRGVDGEAGVMRADERALPEIPVRNRVHAQTAGQRQARGRGVERQDVVADRHPEDVVK